MTTLTLSGVARHYPGPPPVRALRGVDLTVGPGEYVAVQGPSGSGKSTLLNILGLLDRASRGTYTVDGVVVETLTPRAVDQLRAQTFGFVFQAAHLINGWTVAANAALTLRAQRVPRTERAHRVAEALTDVGLIHRAGAPGGVLSGGERQRLAVARALCARPSVLLADEPTGNLDSEHAQDVLHTFDRINARGVTVVVITHDPTVAARARRRAVVVDGTLTEAP